MGINGIFGVPRCFCTCLGAGKFAFLKARNGGLLVPQCCTPLSLFGSMGGGDFF